VIKMKNNLLKKNRKIFLAIITLLIFVFILILVLKNDNLKLDEYMTNLVVNKVRNDNLTTFMKGITFLGSATTLICITLSTFLLIKNKKIPLLITINLITVTLLNQLLKFTFQRNRPLEDFLIEESGYSFPSGHAMVSMAFYGLLIYLIMKSTLKKRTKIIINTILTIIILLIGFSRIYLGVHYTSDVLAGISIATTYLMIFISITLSKIKLTGEKYEK